MNIKRYIFWASFIIILGLIIWGLVVAMNKAPVIPGQNLGTPAPISVGDHVEGPSDAPITVIEYSDFQCPACKAYYFLVEQLIASSTVPFRFVYRQFPLAQHVNSIPAAIASEAAAIQGRFWEMHKYLFEDSTSWVDLKDPNPKFIEYAKNIGLDISKFNIDLASSTLKDKIRASSEEGIKIGIDRTPTFFINGKVVSPQNYDEFKSLIEKAASDSTK